MKPPCNAREYRTYIACETARTAWPGSMMRGELQVLRKGAKQRVEEFFTDNDMHGLWGNPAAAAKDYLAWHRRVCRDLAEHLCRCRCMGAKRNTPDAVSAKLIDTFMHQLMKTQEFRILWRHLHLPLDSRVFAALRRRSLGDWQGRADVIHQLRKPAYTIEREEYERIQESLWGLIELMRRIGSGDVRWTSRIELNWLWI